MAKHAIAGGVYRSKSRSQLPAPYSCHTRTHTQCRWGRSSAGQRTRSNMVQPNCNAPLWVGLSSTAERQPHWCSWKHPEGQWLASTPPDPVITRDFFSSCSTIAVREFNRPLEKNDLVLRYDVFLFETQPLSNRHRSVAPAQARCTDLAFVDLRHPSLPKWHLRTCGPSMRVQRSPFRPDLYHLYFTSGEGEGKNKTQNCSPEGENSVSYLVGL